MFGIVQKPCKRHHPELADQWLKHMCGACLTIRDTAGQLSRATLNNDAILLSVLVEAQSVVPTATESAGRCVLRGMRTAQVTASSSGAAKVGSAMSIVLAGAKVKDDLTDNDKTYTKIPGVSRLGARLEANAKRLAETIGLDFGQLMRTIELEDTNQAARDYAAARLTMEAAYSQVFARAAILADQPENEPACQEFGAALGSITAISDALVDYEDDRRRGKFNLLGDIEPEHIDAWVAKHISVQVERLKTSLAIMKIRDGRLLQLVVKDTVLALQKTTKEIHKQSIGSTGRSKVISEAKRRYGRMSLNSAARVSGCGCGCDCCDCCDCC